MPIVVIGMLAILAVAGLALDSSHALANKTRMQNTVDAAALAAAKVLDQTADTTEATVAAFGLFGINASAGGNQELDAAYSSGEITVSVQYSTTVNPFTPGSPDGPFVRVAATGFDTDTTLSRVLGIDEIATPASAVAGPSGPLGVGDGAELCDVAPIAVCPPEGGYVDNQLEVLKPGPGNHSAIGPGNYKMLRLGCNGGSCLRKNLAGDYGGCATLGETVETEPGISSGPTSQGFNTRFGIYQGGGMNSDDYPPDRVLTDQSPQNLKACEDDTVDPVVDHVYLQNGNGKNYCKSPDPTDQVTMADEIPYSYDSSYASDSEGEAGQFAPGSAKNRRLLIFPIVNCTGDESGQSTLTVEGFACFFMLQALETGQSDGGGKIIGEYVDRCEANGTSGSNPGGGPAGPLLYKIQLYKDSASVDS
ncbi:MAG: Tad domain-containing protein [Gammaproteobacteria bacterium]|nr:Tad domain-containing protein [Gammaproteobacteria bacterium]